MNEILLKYLKDNYDLQNEDIYEHVNQLSFDTKNIQFLYLKDMKPDSYAVYPTPEDLKNDMIEQVYKGTFIGLVSYLNKHMNEDQIIAIAVRNLFLSARSPDFCIVKYYMLNTHMVNTITQCVELSAATKYRVSHHNKIADSVILFKKGSKEINFCCIGGAGRILREKKFIFDCVRKGNLRITPSYMIERDLADKYNVKVEDIADVKQGYNLSRATKQIKEHRKNISSYEEFCKVRLNENREYFPVTPQNIHDTLIDDNIQGITGIEDSIMENSGIRKGDVILSMRGTVIKAAMASVADTREMFATSNVILVRPKRGVDGEFLLAYFNSPKFKSYCGNISEGSISSFLSNEDILKAPILRYEPKEIKELNEQIEPYKHIRERYIEALEKLKLSNENMNNETKLLFR